MCGRDSHDGQRITQSSDRSACSVWSMQVSQSHQSIATLFNVCRSQALALSLDFALNWRQTIVCLAWDPVLVRETGWDHAGYDRNWHPPPLQVQTKPDSATNRISIHINSLSAGIDSRCDRVQTIND